MHSRAENYLETHIFGHPGGARGRRRGIDDVRPQAGERDARGESEEQQENVLLFQAEGAFLLVGKGLHHDALQLGQDVAAELFEKQLRLDDNFSIPLIVGLCLELAARFL